MKELTFDRLFPRFFTGWCLAALMETLVNPYGFDTLLFLETMNLWRFFTILLTTVLLLTVAARRFDTRRAEIRLLTGSAFAYLFILALRESQFWFSLGLVLVITFVAVYAFRDDRLGLSIWQPSRRLVITLIALAAGIFTLFTAAVTVCRYLGYASSTFDLGIFSQMFYYMRTTGLPLTTCERTELLSHFAVHISPIWYLLLPGYMLFPSPVYLQIMQALILASGVIPLYLLLQKAELSRKVQLAVCICFCCFPALAGGCFYDIHENCFLTPLLLWMFYFFETNRYIPVYLFALLTLSVKEDAAVYIAAFALYLLIGRKNYRHGAGLLALAVLYFFASTALLTAYGEGAMTASRFGAYLPSEDAGMFSVVKTIFLNPAYLFEQVFTAEKIQFLLLMLLPLLFLPLCSKKLSGLLLLIPLLVVNVMPDWQYQYSIHFQYVFGNIALLFYLTVQNLREIPVAARRFLLPLAVVVTVLLSTADLSGYTNTVTQYFSAKEINTAIAAALNTIPDDASVKCNGYYLPAISDRDIVYDFDSAGKAEYIVLDLRPGKENNEEANARYRYDTTAYETVVYKEDIIAIYRDRQWQNTAQ